MAAGARQPTSDQASAGARVSPAADRLDTARGRVFRAGQEIAGPGIAGSLTLERPLGRRGTVWFAVDASGSPRAVKSGPRVPIEHEARVLGELSHPNIVRLDCRVRDEETSMLVLEYVGGGDLVSLAGAALPRWIGALGSLVAALGYLHGRGFVHRDLKARNALIAEDDSVRLVDFGSALRIGSGWTAGGTTAVAPDRGSAPVAPADDVYALAALVHELIHGAPPGRGRLPQIPDAVLPLAAVADRCLESYPAATAMGLAGFRTVIESLSQRSLGQT